MRDAVVDGENWVADCTNGVETVLNKGSRVRMAYQNADYCCQSNNPPQPISKKGRAVRDAVDLNQGHLFDNSELDNKNKKFGIWYILVSEINGVVNVELSLPTRVTKNGSFESFYERIFILVNHTIDDIDLSNHEEDNLAYDDSIEIKVK